MWARAWGFLTGRPQTWRQALVEAIVLGILFVVLQLWLGVFSLSEDPWFLAWWVPLWLAASLTGYAFWSWLGRRHRPLQESGPPR